MMKLQSLHNMAALAFAILAIAPSAHGEGIPDFRHIKVESPTSLSPHDAELIYKEIRGDMAAAYARTGLALVRDYSTWRRYNRAPYRSDTHGNRFVNNYANAKAIGYEMLENGIKMPPGAVFAKDSFTLSTAGAVQSGRLFVMEKLAPDANPVTEDWRYMMIGADGTLIGDTMAASVAQVDFCHICHKVRRTKDYLFYVPPDYRQP